MNKLGVVLGVAAVATFSGCLDPNYSDRLDQVRYGSATEVADDVPATTEVSDTTAGEQVKVIAVETTPVEVVEEPKAEVKAEPVAPVKEEVKAPVAAPVEETTVYIVQRGDYLAKISKKYNVKIDAIKKLNPQIGADNSIMLGQKIKLPGKIDVGDQTVPAGAIKAAPAKEYKAYSGATKEYTVKSGDTLGGIAYSNGINIRQLKEMNGLNSNLIRVGQKLKIPAEKVEKPAVVKAAEPAKEAPVKTEPAKDVVAEPAPVAPTAVDEVAAADTAVAAPEVSVEGPTHIVQEGEDLLGLSLMYSLDPAEIRSLNNLGENDMLKPGQVIKLPADVNL